MKTKTASVLLAVLIAAVFVCMIFANSIQTANGSVAVTEGFIESNAGDLAYKLYTPKTATVCCPCRRRYSA